jgi:S1-C subfamily serine protease
MDPSATQRTAAHRVPTAGGTAHMGEHPPYPHPGSHAARVATHHPTSSFPATSGFPATGAAPVTSPGPTTGGFVGGSPGAPPARRRRSLSGPIALVLVLVLVAVTAVQGYLLVNLRRDLDAAERRADAARVAAEEREAGLEQRTKELERQAGNNLDAAAVAGGVLPSVFRVSTAAGTGTGFAFGNETPEGGTYLLTNFHVVELVYNRGERTIALEQRNRRFTAEVVKVDPGADLALLVAGDKFPKLQPAPEAAKPGQGIVVVGAPLGLDDSVTSGVVSALRTVGGRPVLQFDAPINPGNSGGPVVNAQMQVVGVVNAKLNNAEGISLGIPVAVACQTFSLC